MIYGQCVVQVYNQTCGVTKHRTGRTGPKYRSVRYKKGSNRRVQSVNTCDASTITDLTWFEWRFEIVVVLSAAGLIRWCGLRLRLGALLTVSVPSVDSAYSAESTDSILTKSATKSLVSVGLSKRRRDRRRDTCYRLPRERLPYRNIVQSEQHNILQEWCISWISSSCDN